MPNTDEKDGGKKLRRIGKILDWATIDNIVSALSRTCLVLEQLSRQEWKRSGGWNSTYDKLERERDRLKVQMRRLLGKEPSK